MSEKNEFVRSVAEKKYEFGFTTDVHSPTGCCSSV